jgi:hypothetical protein
LISKDELSRLLDDIDQTSLLHQCDLKALVLISEQVGSKDKSLYIQILKKIVLNSLGISQTKDHYNILSKS